MSKNFLVNREPSTISLTNRTSNFTTLDDSKTALDNLLKNIHLTQEQFIILLLVSASAPILFTCIICVCKCVFYKYMVKAFLNCCVPCLKRIGLNKAAVLLEKRKKKGIILFLFL